MIIFRIGPKRCPFRWHRKWVTRWRYETRWSIGFLTEFTIRISLGLLISWQWRIRDFTKKKLKRIPVPSTSDNGICRGCHGDPSFILYSGVASFYILLLLGCCRRSFPLPSQEYTHPYNKTPYATIQHYGRSISIRVRLERTRKGVDWTGQGRPVCLSFLFIIAAASNKTTTTIAEEEQELKQWSSCRFTASLLWLFLSSTATQQCWVRERRQRNTLSQGSKRRRMRNFGFSAEISATYGEGVKKLRRD